MAIPFTTVGGVTGSYLLTQSAWVTGLAGWPLTIEM
jgi:hypothetical protein